MAEYSPAASPPILSSVEQRAIKKRGRGKGEDRPLDDYHMRTRWERLILRTAPPNRKGPHGEAKTPDP